MRKSVSWAVVPLLAFTFVAPRVARAVGDEHAMHGMAGMAGADSGAAGSAVSVNGSSLARCLVP